VAMYAIVVAFALAVCRLYCVDDYIVYYCELSRRLFLSIWRICRLKARWVEIMIGGLFIYNHKGEVLISRVYRDDIGW